MVPQFGECPELFWGESLSLGYLLLALPFLQGDFRPEEANGGSGEDHIFIPLSKRDKQVNARRRADHFTLLNF